MALLIIRRPGLGNQQVVLPEEGEVTIGRTADNTVVIDDALVSRQHAVITQDPSGHWIRDLGSRNGTRLNGKRLEGDARPLKNGDRIALGGNQVLLSYQMEDATITAGDTTSRWAGMLPWQMQLPGPRWRFLVWLRMAGIVLGVISGALGIIFWLLRLLSS